MNLILSYVTIMARLQHLDFRIGDYVCVRIANFPFVSEHN